MSKISLLSSTLSSVFLLLILLGALSGITLRAGVAQTNTRPISGTMPRLPCTVVPLGGSVIQVPEMESGEPAPSSDLTTPEAPGNRAVPAAQEALPLDLNLVQHLKVAGAEVGETPLRVGNLDILAPIVPLLPGIGATASQVAFNNLPGNPNTPTEDRSFQINLPHGAPLVLTAGKSIAYINQVPHLLRAAPLVLKDRIWLPIFSLAPLLGAATRLGSDGTLYLNPTVQSVELFPVHSALALKIKTSAPLPVDGVLMGTIDDPPKLYFDIPGYSMGFDAANSTTGRVISAGLGDIQQVRAGLFHKFPDTTRIVLDLQHSLKCLAQPLPDKCLYALLLQPGSAKTTKLLPDLANPVSNVVGRGTMLRGLTIVLDPGHGGHDSGAPGARSLEKNHTLDIAKRLRNYLVARGATVLMTREDDTFIPLQSRVDFANSRKADIFFSVHINSFLATSSGTETFYYTAPSLALAREVQQELVKATGLANRGTAQARFFVIRKTWMPSVLTESCYISNPTEEAKLLDPQWRERLAFGMAEGITHYVQHYIKAQSISG